MAITVTARVTITNRTREPVADAILQGDLASAHNDAPLGTQLAASGVVLPRLEMLGTLEPGERREVQVTVRQVLAEIRAIDQGRARVFVPLLRLRLESAGAKPVASTVLVGHPPERAGGKPTPFLAEAPPQNYNQVVGRALG